MATKRSDYLRSLNEMRHNYQTNGNALINREDDTTNVGNDISSFAYMNTTPAQANEQVPAQASEQEPYKYEEGNHIGAKGSSFFSSLEEGAFNLIDSIGDFFIGTFGWIADKAGNKELAESARNAMNYDWVAQATNFTDLVGNWAFNIANPDYYNGKAWGSLGSAEASRQRLTNLRNKALGTTGAQITQMVGNVLPDIAITVGTFGSSKVGTLGKIAINAGISGVESAGQGFSVASKDTGQIGDKELLYGLAKGGIAFGTSFALGKLGANVGQGTGAISKALGKTAGKLLNSETAEVLTGTISNVLGKATSAFGRSVALQSIEPYLKSIYDEGKAVEEAYGDEARKSKYFQQVLANAGVSATLAGVISAVRTGVDIKSKGWDKYKSDYIVNTRLNPNDIIKAKAYDKERQDILDNFKKRLKIKDIVPFAEGSEDVNDPRNPYLMAKVDRAVSKEEFEYACIEANEALTKLNQKYDKFFTKVENMDKYQGFREKEVNDVINGMKYTADKSTNLNDVGETIKSLFRTYKYYKEDVKSTYNKEGANFETKDGNEVHVDSNGNALIRIGDKIAPVKIKENEIVIDGSKNDGIKVLANLKSDSNIPYSVNNIDLKTETSMPKLEMSKEVAKKIMSNTEVKEAIKSGAISDKNEKVYTIRTKDGQEKVVIPYKDKSLIVSTNGNKINSIEIKKHFKETGEIVPKDNADNFINTKAISEKTGQVIGIEQGEEPLRVGMENYLGVFKIFKGGVKTQAGGYVYSEKPLFETQVKKILSYNNLTNYFPMDEIKKEYVKAFYHQTGKEVLELLANEFGGGNLSYILDQIGYDGYINEDNGVVIIPKHYIIRGGSFTYGKERKEGNNRAISVEQRSIRKTAIEQLQRDFGENGRKNIENAQNKIEYQKLIIEGKLYETEELIDFSGARKIKVIPQKYYDKKLKEINDFVKKAGMELKVCIRSDTDPDKFFTIDGAFNNNTICVFLTDISNVSAIKLIKHEYTHGLFDIYELEKRLHLISEIRNSNDEEIKELKEIYEVQLGYSEYEVAEEIVCDVNAGLIELKNKVLQNKIINGIKNFNKTTDFKKLRKEINERLAKEEREDLGISYSKKDANVITKKDENYRYRYKNISNNTIVRTNTKPTQFRYYDAKKKKWFDPTKRTFNPTYQTSESNGELPTSTENPNAPIVPARLQQQQPAQKVEEPKPAVVKKTVPPSKPPKPNSNQPVKLISNKQRNSSRVLIEAGADVSKPTKVRLNSVKEAFNTAIQEVLPASFEYHIPEKDEISSFAELNLSRPKDRDIAIDNMVKYLGRAEIKFGDDSRFKLKDIMTQPMEEQFREIMSNVIKGKAEPTKLAKWANALQLEKIDNAESVRSFKLLNRLNRRIESSQRLNFGYGNAPKVELTVFKNILNGIKPFYDNKTITQLADNILLNYTEENIGDMFEQFGIPFDRNIIAVAQNLKDDVVAGRHLSPLLKRQANDLLQLIYNNLNTIDKAVNNENVKNAEKDINIIQSIYGTNGNNLPKGKIRGIAGLVEAEITSPADFFEMHANGTELQKLVSDETGKYENEEKQVIEDVNKKIMFDDKKKYREIEKLSNKKFVFKGEKISYGTAVHRLNLHRTLGEDFFKANGYIKNKDFTRGVVSYTPEDIENLKKAIPQELLDYNEKVLKEVLNGSWQEWVKKKYKEVTKTDLHLLDNGNLWYPINRVSDNAMGVKQGGTSFRDIDLSMFNKRVNSKADINFDDNFINHITNYFTTATRKLVWQPYVNKLNTILNTRAYGTTTNKELQRSLAGYNDEIDLLFRQVLRVPDSKKITLGGKIVRGILGNLNAVRVSTIQAGLRTLSSVPEFMHYFGAKTGAEGIIQYIKNGWLLSLKRNYDIITKEVASPYFKNRFGSDEVVIAQSGAKIAKKISKITGLPLRGGDAEVHLGLGFAIAQVLAEKQGYGKPYTKNNNERAVWLLEQASKKTQPTNSIGNVANFRYGNGLKKYLFGLYGSMKQVFTNGLIRPIHDLATHKKIEENIANAIKEHEKKIKEYADLEKIALDDMNKATNDEEYSKAKKEYEKAKMHKEGHERAKTNTEDYFKRYKENHTNKKIWDRAVGSFAGLIFSSILYVAISNMIKVWEGKKSINDMNIKDFSVDFLEQAFVNSIPYLSTLYGTIRNKSDLSIATLDNFNKTIDAFRSLISAIESGDAGKITGSMLKSIEQISNFLGIPLESTLKLVNGTWYNIDKESNIAFNGWLGNLKPDTLKTHYSEAVKNGDHDKAVANLEVWLYNNAVPTDKKVVEEIYNLNVAGVKNVAPSAVPKEYTNVDGETVKLTSSQINAFKTEYSKSNNSVSSLIETQSYRSLDSENKGSAIKKIYQAYYDSAKAKLLGVKPNSKLAQLVYYCNGDINLAKYVAHLQQLNTITQDDKHSKKENVLKEINKISGLSKAEKLLLLYLAGYGVSEENTTKVMNVLTSLGISRENAKEFLKIE